MKRLFIKIFISTILLLFVIAPFSLANFPEVSGNEISEPAHTDKLNIEERWGIKILSIRQSAAGYMLDFRYRVMEPEKAIQLNNRKVKPYLIDQTSGAKLLVPNPPKIGPLRQTSVKPIPGRTYFILFANPGKFVKPGNKVTVVIGDFRAEGLTVE